MKCFFFFWGTKMMRCCYRKNYYKEGDYIYPKFDAVEAYRKAIETWAKWIDKNVDPGKLVFYRGYSSAHFRYCLFLFVFTVP